MDISSTATPPPHADRADELVAGIARGDRRSLARAITLVESGDAVGTEVVAALYPGTGSAAITGITGPPGVGKSTLVGALVHHLRAQENAPEIGVVSVDPSSPFTQGALLGDRIRMAEHFLDRGVFIRSMGTRGHGGGLAAATLQVMLLLDAFGRREILLETVGVGQSEVGIARLADTVLLVLMPGSGDAVQALKAGIMEIPDVIVINKADHPQARELHQQVRQALQLSAERDWVPPIIETTAIENQGIDRLWSAITEHREFLAVDNRLQERRDRQLAEELLVLAAARARTRLEARIRDDAHLQQLLQRVQRRELDPITCVDQMLSDMQLGDT